MSAPAPAPLPAPPEEVELAPVDGTVPLPDPVMLRAAICSVVVGPVTTKAFRLAKQFDTISAYGLGIFNKELD